MNSMRVKEIVGILMESKFYFDLSLRERHCLIKHLLRAFSFTGSASLFYALPPKLS